MRLLTSTTPGGPPLGDVDDDDLRSLYAYPPGCGTGRPWLRANMVSSVDGAASVDGESGGLSGVPDKRVFGVLRGLADAVVVGAGTARREGYRAPSPKPAYQLARSDAGQAVAPALVLVSSSLDLDLDGPMFDHAAVPTVVVTHAGADAGRLAATRAVAEVVVAGDDHVDIGAALDALAARGLTRVLCEGGPSLLADVVAAGRLDEICATTGPLVVAGDAPRIAHGPAPAAPLPVHLAHLLLADDVLLARWVRG